jgi:hypothetical protein
MYMNFKVPLQHVMHHEDGLESSKHVGVLTECNHHKEGSKLDTLRW